MYLFFPVALSFALSLTLSRYTHIFLTEKTASNDAAAARRRALEQLTGTHSARRPSSRLKFSSNTWPTRRSRLSFAPPPPPPPPRHLSIHRVLPSSTYVHNNNLFWLSLLALRFSARSARHRAGVILPLETIFFGRSLVVSLSPRVLPEKILENSPVRVSRKLCGVIIQYII